MTPSTATESIVWSGSPSQWLNFGTFLLCIIIAAAIVTGAIYWAQPKLYIALVLPVFVAFRAFVRVRSMKIEVTTERITTQVGIFSRRREDLELYRVKDSVLIEPFLLRIVRRATIQLRSSDRTTPNMMLPAIANAEALRQQIRANVERLRAQRGVREMDMDVERDG